MSKKDLNITINTDMRRHGHHDPGAFPIALK